ncbi:MAG: ascorbate-dependent monooxygenase, partial [Isosphaeraceae bacterium]
LVVLNHHRINIPPGDSEHVVTESLTLPADVKLYGVFPHMHLIGRSMSLVANLPDGTSRPLINISDWDFQWQFYYRYASPVLLPAGTKLEGRWTFDNSEDNLANPSHPPQRVTFGEQTTHEMAIIIMDVVPVRSKDDGK